MITGLISVIGLLVAAIAALFVQSRKAREASARAKISEERVEVADKVVVATEAAIVTEREEKKEAAVEFEAAMEKVEETKEEIDTAVAAGGEELADEWNKYIDERR